MEQTYECKDCCKEKAAEEFRACDIRRLDTDSATIRCRECWKAIDKSAHEKSKASGWIWKGRSDAAAPSLICRGCQQELPATSFHPSELKWRRSSARCIPCRAQYETAMRQRKYQRSPEIHEREKNRKREYHAENREKHIRLGKQHYQENIKLYDFWRSKSAAKRRGATMFMTLEQWETLRDQKNCHWCQIELSPPITHVDHLTPLIQGGQHTIENVVLACANCNLGREWKRKVTDWKLKNFEESQQELPKE